MKTRNYHFKWLAPLAAASALCFGGVAHAVTFNLFYDNYADQVIGTNNIVGTGTFSYSGPLTFGSFALDSLSGVSYSASFDGGLYTFGTADIQSDPSVIGIDVFNLGGGTAGMVFTGTEASNPYGSLDLINPAGNILSHEPTSTISNPVGCCGGNGTINEYFLALSSSAEGDIYYGDYLATTGGLPSSVPEPQTLADFGIGLIAIVLLLIWETRRRRRRYFDCG